MSNWIIHFLISNIFICIFTLVIIGTKKLLKKYLSAATQYHLCFLLFLLHFHLLTRLLFQIQLV